MMGARRKMSLNLWGDVRGDVCVGCVVVEFSARLTLFMRQGLHSPVGGTLYASTTRKS